MTVSLLHLDADNSLGDHVSGAQLAHLGGVTYRRVDFWTRSGYLQCVEATPGSGFPRIYPISEVAVVRLIADLVEHGLLPNVAAVRARELLETGTTHIAGMPLHLPQEL